MDKKLAKMEIVFKALADSTRLRIIGLLFTGEVCVCHIHKTLRISQPKASRHLAYLRKAGLVQTRREGLWIHYRMTDVADAVLATLQRTVTHSLRHLDVIQKDAERLQKITGCGLPPDDDQQAYACCVPLTREAVGQASVLSSVRTDDHHVPVSSPRKRRPGDHRQIAVEG